MNVTNVIVKNVETESNKDSLNDLKMEHNTSNFQLLLDSHRAKNNVFHLTIEAKDPHVKDANTSFNKTSFNENLPDLFQEMNRPDFQINDEEYEALLHRLDPEENASYLTNELVDFIRATIHSTKVTESTNEAVDFPLLDVQEEFVTQISNDEVNHQVKNLKTELHGAEDKHFQSEITSQQMASLGREIAELVRNNSNLANLKDSASRLLPILQKWDSMKQQLKDPDLHRLITNELTDKESAIWKHVAGLYEKRNHFTNHHVYRAESNVTRSDVMKWLQQAMDHYVNPKEPLQVNVVTHQSPPMKEVQQYMIHVQHLESADKVSEELIHKFQHIIRKSRFIHTNHGNQLSIMLQPENLGNMTVRMQQVDGEITVKIVVSTQVAREMLENNLHQLKHMFSPHQVVIERDELVSDEEFFHGENEQEEHSEETPQDSDESKDKEDESSKIDFETIFSRFSEEEITNE